MMIKRNNRLVATLIFAVNFVNLSAQTSIPGGDVQGTWTVQNSPYLIQGDISIADATELTIEPGVQVEFQGDYELLVQGSLKSIGTEKDSIRFTATSEWGGMRFMFQENVDSSWIFYTHIEKGNSSGGNNLDHQYGGGIYLDYFHDIAIEHCTFYNNKADWGGGISFVHSDAVIRNCAFIANEAALEGGAIDVSFANPTILGVLCYKNKSSYNGGALAIKGNDPVQLYNSTLIENTAVYGGGLYLSSTPTVLNTISWDNTASSDGDEVYLSEMWNNETEPVFRNCNIEGGKAGFGLEGVDYAYNYAGASNLDVLPEMDNRRKGTLASSSPCINSGTNDALVAGFSNDLLGQARKDGTQVDIGATEYPGTVGIEVVEDNIKFYPNPVVDRLVVQRNLEGGFVQICNAQGAQVLSTRHNEISCAEWAPGSYFLLVRNRQGKLLARTVFIKR